MKIFFAIDCLASGGKERRLVELMRTLKSNKEIDFELIIMSTDIHYSEVFDMGIKINYLIRSRKKDMSVFVRLYRLCKNYRPDIIHCWDSMTAFYCTPVCKILHIKNVNGMVVDSPGKRKILYIPWLRAKIIFPFTDLIIGNSRAGLKAYNAPAKKSTVIYNGFNFDRVIKLKSDSSKREELKIDSGYIVGMVATYSEFKDYPTYFKAAQLIIDKRKDVTFLAIGKNTDSELSIRNIDGRYSEHFRLLGERSDVESYINIFDIGVLATFTEGISNSILECMAIGKPVVATNGGGTSEIIEDQKTGYLVSPSNPEDLAEKILILLNDVSLRKKMGENSKVRIHETFSIENMTGKYVSEYKKLVSQ